MESSLPSVNTTLLALECMATYKTYKFSGSHDKSLKMQWLTTPGLRIAAIVPAGGHYHFCLAELRPSVSCDVNHKVTTIN